MRMLLFWLLVIVFRGRRRFFALIIIVAVHARTFATLCHVVVGQKVECSSLEKRPTNVRKSKVE